jgi:hypothetical protein
MMQYYAYTEKRYYVYYLFVLWVAIIGAQVAFFMLGMFDTIKVDQGVVTLTHLT